VKIKSPFILLEQCYAEAQLPTLAKEIVTELIKKQAFCLWLDAPMGCGKTSLVKFLLHTVGLPLNIPVTSPTYSYINTYMVNSRRFIHIDCYRLDMHSILDDLLYSVEDIDGIFIEWPERLFPQAKEILTPTHKIQIEFSKFNPLSRRFYRLISLNNANNA